MKKKLLFGMMAALTLAASCQNDFDYVSTGEETAQVTFNVGTPEIATRTFSDGKSATQLEYAVYSVGENDTLTHLDLDGEKTFSISTDVQLQLTTGNKYAVIFWAAAENAPYTVDFDAKTMTVDYANAVSNDEKRDAFYAYHEFTVTGSQTETVYLKRPFAQLNIGTSDYTVAEAAGYAPAYSYVKVPVYNTLDLVEGKVSTVNGTTTSNEAVATEFKLAAIPDSSVETFPVAGYEYLLMNYLLVPADKEVVDIEFGYSTNNTTVEKSRIVGSVPVQRNHRTNIYGQLLTSDVDVNIEIKPGYDDPALPETVEEQLNIAAQLGGTVTLTEDVVLTEPLVISGVQTRAASAIALELDLNGHNITYTSDAAAHSAMITVNAGQKLTIKDSQGTGKITYNYTGAGDPNFGWGTYTIDNNGGTLVVEDATIEIISNLNDANGVKHMYCAIYQYSGSTTINGGTISNSTYRSARLWKGNMTINGGVFEGQLWVQAVDDTAVLTINGGSFAPSGADSSSVFVTNSTYNPTLKVTGGTFETKLGCSDYTKSGVKGSVSGGVFGVMPDANLFADGLHAVEANGQFYITADDVDVVASSKEDLPKTDDGSKIDTNFDENTALFGDITLSAGETNANSGYAATGVKVSNGAVLDGQGHTLTVNDANSTWACCVAVTGGTIKNLTVAGAMRGIFMPGADGDVYIDNVIFKDVVYTFNSDAGDKNYGVYISNCTINGWTSHSDVHKEVVYTNCSFGEGSGYAFCRPYGPTSFVGCDFEAGFAIDARGKVTFENCTVGGVALTAENLATLVTSKIENASVK